MESHLYWHSEIIMTSRFILQLHWLFNESVNFLNQTFTDSTRVTRFFMIITTTLVPLELVLTAYKDQIVRFLTQHFLQSLWLLTVM